MDTLAMPVPSDTPISVPKLTETNYTQWAPLMKNVLKINLVWGIVQGREREPSAEDRRESFFTRQDFATSQIYLNCDSAIQEKVVDIDDPAELWTFLKANSEKSNLVSEYWLRKRLYSIEFAECGSVEAYVGAIQETIDEINVCNPEEPIGPGQHCFVLCDGLPADWLPLIESLHKAGRTSRNPAELIRQFISHEKVLRQEQAQQEQKRLRVRVPPEQYGQRQEQEQQQQEQQQPGQGQEQRQQEQQEQQQHQEQEEQQHQHEGQGQQEQEDQQQNQQQQNEQEREGQQEQEQEQDNTPSPANEPPNTTAGGPDRNTGAPGPASNYIFSYRGTGMNSLDLEDIPVSFHYAHNLPLEFQYYLCSPVSSIAFMTDQIHELYAELCRRIYINDRKEHIIFGNEQVGDVCIYIKPIESAESSVPGESSSAGAASSEGSAGLKSRKLLIDWVFETPDWKQQLCDYFWDIPKVSGGLLYRFEVEYQEHSRMALYFNHEREFESLGITLEMFFPPENDEATMSYIIS